MRKARKYIPRWFSPKIDLMVHERYSLPALAVLSPTRSSHGWSNSMFDS